jgi:site-specific recombinase XerD
MPRKQPIEKHKGVYEKSPGSGIWWIRWTNAQGKRVTESIGRHGDAVTMYRQRITEKRAGLIIPIGKSARGVRFSSLVEDVLKFSESNHRDQRNFKQRIEVAKEHLGNRAADSITPKELGEWLSEMAEENEWTAATFNRYKAAISKAYKIGMQNRRVSTNPARFVPQRKESVGRIRFLTEEEEKRLRAAILKNRPHCVYQLDVALNTGMRKGEQFGITWEQVDFKRGYIHLDETKNGRDRYVHLNDAVSASLKALKEECKSRKLEFDTLFFDRRNEPIQDPRMWFASACVEAKIKGVTWHTLRHTFASRLVMAGVNLKTVQELMGHKTIGMTARYAHLAPGHLKDAVNKLAKSA